MPGFCCRAQIASDAAAELPAADAVTAGGENPSERRCTFLDLALYLSSGLDASAIAILYKAIRPVLQVRHQCISCSITLSGPCRKALSTASKTMDAYLSYADE